ncbi:MAG: serine/threonine protein kinase, partial [Acidobacteriota bacterium]
GGNVQEILMKHLQARPKAPHELDPAVPRPISDAIMKALQVDPEHRIPTAKDLASALSGALKASAA